MQQVQTLLSEDSIVVDSALCLGMGSLERADLAPLPSCTLDPDSWDSVSFCPVASGRERNVFRDGVDLPAGEIHY